MRRAPLPGVRAPGWRCRETAPSIARNRGSPWRPASAGA
jgi:hypothetical protein